MKVTEHEVVSTGKEFNTFETGAQRDNQTGKGRFDLIPWDVIWLVALVFERGAIKYDERNWEKGMPCSRYWNSAMRHMIKEWMGLTDEDHGSQAIWNMICYMRTKIQHPELNDFPMARLQRGLPPLTNKDGSPVEGDFGFTELYQMYQDTFQDVKKGEE